MDGEDGGRRANLEAEINQPHIPIREIEIEENNIAIQGEVVAFDKRTPQRQGLVTFDVWDHTDSITCKLFLILKMMCPKSMSAMAESERQCPVSKF